MEMGCAQALKGLKAQSIDVEVVQVAFTNLSQSSGPLETFICVWEELAESCVQRDIFMQIKE